MDLNLCVPNWASATVKWLGQELFLFWGTILLVFRVWTYNNELSVPERCCISILHSSSSLTWYMMPIPLYLIQFESRLQAYNGKLRQGKQSQPIFTQFVYKSSPMHRCIMFAWNPYNNFSSLQEFKLISLLVYAPTTCSTYLIHKQALNPVLNHS